MKYDEYRIAKRLYRGTFLVTLFLFLCGLNVYGWRTSGVNHILIFEINPRSHLSEQHIMEISMIFAIFWTTSVLGFIFSDSLGVPIYVNPLLLLFFVFSFLLNPSKTLFHEARCWFLRIMVGTCFVCKSIHTPIADKIYEFSTQHRCSVYIGLIFSPIHQSHRSLAIYLSVCIYLLYYNNQNTCPMEDLCRIRGSIMSDVEHRVAITLISVGRAETTCKIIL